MDVGAISSSASQQLALTKLPGFFTVSIQGHTAVLQRVGSTSRERRTALIFHCGTWATSIGGYRPVSLMKALLSSQHGFTRWGVIALSGWRPQTGPAAGAMQRTLTEWCFILKRMSSNRRHRDRPERGCSSDAALLLTIAGETSWATVQDLAWAVLVARPSSSPSG